MPTPTEMVYNGHKITLMASFKFAITGPHTQDSYDKKHVVESAEEARKWIDSRDQAAKRQAKAKLGLKCVAFDHGDGSVKSVTVNGIHSSQGVLLGVDHDGVYVDHPWVKRKLVAFAEHMLAMRDLTAELRPANIRRQRSYGRISSERYDTEIEGLKKEHEKALAYADSKAKSEVGVTYVGGKPIKPEAAA